jgi:FAD/FMN-containing dehydrogenase
MSIASATTRIAALPGDRLTFAQARLERYRSALAYRRTIRASLDPNNILNPGELPPPGT